MDHSDIPVLTKVVQKGKTPPAVQDDLVQQLKQALLPELTAEVERLLSAQTAQEKQAQSQVRVGEHIQRIEEAFIESMQQRSELLVQALESQVAQLAAKQEAQERALQQRLEGIQQAQMATFESRLSSLRETPLQVLDDSAQALRERLSQTQQEWQAQSLTPWLAMQYAEIEAQQQQWRAQFEQALGEHLQAWQSQTLAQSAQEWLAAYQQNMQQQFEQMRADALEAFKQQLEAQLAAALQSGLDEKVAALVAQQLPELQGELQKRLKGLILEVLQGIKFVMPPL